MRTTINAKDAEWPAEVRALWDARVVPGLDERPVSTANYFTPRPYVDQYSRGSDKAGFVFVIGRQVYVAEWYEKAAL